MPENDAPLPPSDLRRVAIEAVEPEIDCGRFPIKRVVGEDVVVQADIHAEGHDLVAAVLLYKEAGEPSWRESPMRLVENDRWQGRFRIATLAPCLYTILAWVDDFRSWSRDFLKKADAAVAAAADVLAGSEIVESAAARAQGADAARLREIAVRLRASSGDTVAAADAARSPSLAELMDRHADRSGGTIYPKQLRVTADPEKARFSAWYEMFPRSCTANPARHGTFRDCIARLDYIAEMGFDVLYLPPIHPIGLAARKGPNNSPIAQPGDPGTPWAIGLGSGGFTSVHPQLGNLDDFAALQRAAAAKGIDLALDLAFQCSPDHPYVREHPEWFKHRADGTIQFAENPPKKYEDIYPLFFGSPRAAALCEELRRAVLFWIEKGIRIFRVDNPHTKPYAFWEWLIGEIRREHPEVIFLAEAFTRPKIMYRLAKLGFSQSYTYFAWKNVKWEITQYFTEITRPPVSEFFRPNLWPNTPDILTDYLQRGGRPAFMARLILAATLGANYGIYGPAFELCENRAVRPGSEEYLDSEKYQVRAWDVNTPGSLKPLIARVNAIRRGNRALQSDANLRFHSVDNDQLIAYTKSAPGARNVILTVVNLDAVYKQSGWVDLPLPDLGLDPRAPYAATDLLTGARYRWQGSRNYVELDPGKIPAHILLLAPGDPAGAP
ncbi:MAG TPA: alpha-1,4-glucan--maltose-1-phosphate maltosyltransferase [Candidatus Acidoferrales bacterium]|nr:alpha-1,4-glucan--maltose-1-phosphate maltosyltransferase [Candidatus Acidoferrales bacterium]